MFSDTFTGQTRAFILALVCFWVFLPANRDIVQETKQAQDELEHRLLTAFLGISVNHVFGKNQATFYHISGKTKGV